MKLFCALALRCPASSVAVIVRCPRVVAVIVQRAASSQALFGAPAHPSLIDGQRQQRSLPQQQAQPPGYLELDRAPEQTETITDGVLRAHSCPLQCGAFVGCLQLHKPAREIETEVASDAENELLAELTARMRLRELVRKLRNLFSALQCKAMDLAFTGTLFLSMVTCFVALFDRGAF